jgi:uncharacterized protein YcbK (DUF882 family)
MILKMLGIEKQQPQPEPESPKEEPKPEKPMENEKKEIDWTDLSSKISKYFTVKEAIWLPQENRACSEDELSDEIKENLIATFQWMDTVREYFGKPITVTICLRTMAYHIDLYKRINEKNKAAGKPEVKVPMGSMHPKGKAVDFVVKGMTCDEVKKKILDENKLEEWNLRLEDNGQGANWIHLDDREPGPGGRFFKP